MRLLSQFWNNEIKGNLAPGLKEDLYYKKCFNFKGTYVHVELVIIFLERTVYFF